MRHTASLLLSFSLVACGGTIGGDPDAQVPSDGLGDMTPDAAGGACDLMQPFGSMTPLAAINSAAGEDHGWLSADRLTIYMASNRTGGPGGFDLYYATRSSATDPFGSPTLLPSINSDTGDYAPVVTDDGLTMFFSSQRSGTWNIYQATRTSTATSFGQPAELLNVNSAQNEHPTHIDASGTRLYLSSTRAGDWDLYLATRASPAEPFGTPVPMSGVNIPGVEEYGAVLTADELTVFFESLRDSSVGCYAIYMATRSTTADGFGTPQRVAELSTNECAWPTWLSPDGCQIIVTSDRTGDAGGRDLWMATRPQ